MATRPAGGGLAALVICFMIKSTLDQWAHLSSHQDFMEAIAKRGLWTLGGPENIGSKWLNGVDVYFGLDSWKLTMLFRICGAFVSVGCGCVPHGKLNGHNFKVETFY